MNLNISPCILLVQTDQNLTQKVTLDLQNAGYYPVAVADVKSALSELDLLQPSMIILDRQQAGPAGVKFCHQVRKSGNRVLILMLVEQESVEERVACLEAGADDYLIKSYHTQDLLKRVNFYLQTAPTVKEQLRFGDLVLELSNRHLLLNNKEIDLTMKEFELLRYFMSHPREVLTREQILDNVWGYDFRGESNVIEVYIRYLRLKIENEGHRRLIHTVRGVGYVLKEP